MRSVIIYAAYSALTEQHKPVGFTDPHNPGREIYLRTEIVNVAPIDALDHVQLMEGETFLNSIPLDESLTR